MYYVMVDVMTLFLYLISDLTNLQMNSCLLGSSVVRNIQIRNCTVTCVPGLDWEGARERLLQNKEEYRDTQVYILIGPTRFTRKTVRGEVAIRRPDNTVDSLFAIFYNAPLSVFNINPIICTIYPPDLKRYNERARRPILKAFYDEWNAEIIAKTIVENRSICAFNADNGFKTPYIHRRLVHRHGRRWSVRTHLLSDGVHPKHSVQSEWAREITKSLRDNRRQ
jgi:hypothetical protein